MKKRMMLGIGMMAAIFFTASDAAALTAYVPEGKGEETTWRSPSSIHRIGAFDLKGTAPNKRAPNERMDRPGTLLDGIWAIAIAPVQVTGEVAGGAAGIVGDLGTFAGVVLNEPYQLIKMPYRPTAPYQPGQ